MFFLYLINDNYFIRIRQTTKQNSRCSFLIAFSLYNHYLKPKNIIAWIFPNENCMNWSMPQNLNFEKNNGPLLCLSQYSTVYQQTSGYATDLNFTMKYHWQSQQRTYKNRRKVHFGIVWHSPFSFWSTLFLRISLGPTLASHPPTVTSTSCRTVTASRAGGQSIQDSQTHNTWALERSLDQTPTRCP